MKTTYNTKTDPTLEPKISKIKKIDGIISIAGLDYFYDGREKKLREIASWLVHSNLLGIDLKPYLSHFNVDNNKTIGK